MDTKNDLLANLNQLHTTVLGAQRIKENLLLHEEDVVAWCKQQIKNPSSKITRRGKNWYILIEDNEITVNTSSYTIITAHKVKNTTKRKTHLKLDGFGIFVKDMATMIRFYRDVLGFKIKEQEDTSNVFLIKDGTLFLLYRRHDFEKMTHRSYEYVGNINGHYEIALSVENYRAVDDTFQEVISKGAIPVLKPTTEPWGQRTCYIADPEGNLIEIGSFQE